MKITHLFKQVSRQTVLVWLLALLCSVFEFFLAFELATIQQKQSSLLTFAGMLLLLCCLIIILRYLTAYHSQKIAFKLEKKIADLLLKKEATPGQAPDKGKWLTLLNVDNHILAQQLPITITALITGFSSLVAALVFGVFSSPLLTLIIILLSTISVIGPKIFTKLLLQTQKQQQTKQENVQRSLAEILNARDFLRINGYEEFGTKLFQQTYAHFLNEQYQNRKVQAWLTTSSVFFGLLFDVLTLIAEIYLMSIHQLTLGQFISFTLLTDSFTWIFYQAPAYYSELSRQQVARTRVNSYLEQPTITTSVLHKQPAITLKEVGFTYPHNQHATLAQLNLKLDLTQHEKIVLTGQSGGGKTTLLQLLTGELQPTAGRLTFPAQANEHAQLITLVPQDNPIFAGSIQENLLLGRQIPTNELLAISQKIGLDRVLKKFPNGLNHQLKVNGANLSAGQKQLIGIARGLVQLGDLLVLDEPVANLDEKTTQQVFTCLASLPTTVLLVSHQLETEHSNFQKLVLADGKIQHADS